MKKQGYRIRLGLFGSETIMCKDCIPEDLKSQSQDDSFGSKVWKIKTNSNWTGELECLKCKSKIKHKVVI